MLIDDIRGAVSGRTIIVTGHTGFKGGWLTAWLARLGANIVGISLPPDQGEDNLFMRGRIGERCIASHLTDIRDAARMQALFAEHQPASVFHLAAQPLVRRGYQEPLMTFETNVMGTANILEAARQTASVRSVVCITTDKVYHNKEWCWPYREADEIGGIDPYSASKAGAEMVARAYMTTLQRSPEPYLMATARGGNVVGGGDWSEDRIVPDVVRAIRSGETLLLRNPQATRPWQHVLELCFGYLILAWRLESGRLRHGQTPDKFVGAYNFGPEPTGEMPVRDLVSVMLESWQRSDHPIKFSPSPLHESTYLRLDSSKAKRELGWCPLLSFQDTIRLTADWYRRYVDDKAAAPTLISEQIEIYERLIGRLDIKSDQHDRT